MDDMIKLGDVATYINGYAFKPEDRGEVGLPIIRIQDLTGNAYNLGFYNGKYPKKIEINDGDVLISWSASLGVYVWNRGKALLNQHIFKVAFDKVEINQNYFVYAVRYKLAEMGMKTHGATMKHIVKKDFDATQIPYPSLKEQFEIATNLDKISKIVEKRKMELKQLDDLIKARFVEMFGDAVANPMKWPVKKLKDLSVQINSGNTPKGGSENYVEEGITFFRSQNVWKDCLEMDDIVYIDAATHASMKRSSLKHGDILMTKTGRINTENSSLGRAALYDGEDDMANVNGHVYFIRLKEGVNNKFVLRILVSPEYRDLIRSVCVGGIDKRQLNKKHIEDFPIICPPSDMIDKYVTFVEQVDKSKFIRHY
ncbi:restriction endonuclease subunit S [Eubacterium sp.]|uniref:restriction endonuclease subunit S n=1 Tax=Eubacterium sp. TaxID=142586 RepID=UPI00399B4167